MQNIFRIRNNLIDKVDRSLLLLTQKDMDHRIKFKIDEVLRQRGQTLYWLSRTTGVSYTTLWRFTKDRALGLNFSTLEKVCIALECSPGDLMELATEEEQKKSRKLPARAVRRTSSLL